MTDLESLLARIRADGKVSTHTTTVLSVPYEDRPPDLSRRPSWLIAHRRASLAAGPPAGPPRADR